MPEPRPIVISELNPPLNPILVTDRDSIDALGQFLETQKTIGLDTETNVVDRFFDRKLRTIQLGNRAAQYVVDLLALVNYDTEKLCRMQGDYGRRIDDPNISRLVNTLKLYLETNQCLKVGHNLTFDYITLKWCLGLRPWHFFDTELVEKLLLAGLFHSMATDVWGLENVMERYLHLRIDKSQQTSFDLTTPLTEAQILYAALDTRLPLAVMACQKAALKESHQEEPAQIENDALPAFGDLHLNGLLMDTKKWISLVDGIKAKHIQNIALLDKQFIPVVGTKVAPNIDLAAFEKQWRDEKDKVKRKEYLEEYRKHRREIREFEKNKDTYEGEAAINYGSNPQLLDALRKLGFTEKKLKDTNDQSLKRIPNNPTINALRAYRETAKILSTYGESFLENYIWDETGRIHSSFNQYGAATGRSSSTKPNIQNILNGAEWRNCFISRPGYKIITIDYNGCELRILAELSQEPVWIEAFNNGWDVHSVGAEILFGAAWEKAAEPGCAYVAAHQKCDCKGHKKLRKRIKSINFGLAYGMEARKLSEELGIPYEEAEELMASYKGQFVIVTAYLKKSGEYATQKFESRTMSGRRRRYPRPTWAQAEAKAREKLKKGQELAPDAINRMYHAMLSGIQREGKNTPIQGTNGDMIKLAMGCGFDENGKPYSWHLIEPVYHSFLENMVHDELVVESPDSEVAACMEAVQDCMERAGAHFIKSMPVVAEGHIADCWTKE